MIRVLHVIGAMDRGGAETMIMNLYRAIDREQIQFDFMVHETHECDYDAEIQNLGGRIYRVPRFTGSNAVSYKRRFKEFFADNHDHSIVHGHIGSSAAIYLHEAKRAGRYTIAHSHAQKFPVSAPEIAFRVSSYPTRIVADNFLAPTKQAGVDRFGQRFLDSSRGYVLKNGIDTELYACDEKTHQLRKQSLGFDGVPVIGHIGRLVPEKNHAFLLDTFAEIRKSLPETQLVCVGRGELLQELALQTRELRIEDSVHFLGVRSDVPELLQSFDVFLFPSVIEGLGIAAVEAQAAGLPTFLSTGVAYEAAVTDLAQRITLSSGPQEWAELVVSKLESLPERKDRVKAIAEADFDIKNNAEWLTLFYLKHGSTDG